MRVLVYGASGWIGGQVVALLTKRGHEIVPGTTRLSADADFFTELQTVKPERVVLAAGLTGRPNVDWCETNKDATTDVNLFGTVNLIRACTACNIHVTNFATGCVFTYDGSRTPGVDSEGFTETDAPNFWGSHYSLTKGLAELATRSEPTHLLLRLRMPITADGASRCLITKLRAFTHVIDTPNSMSVLPSLLPLAVAMLEAGDVGVYNFVNPGALTHTQVLALAHAPPALIHAGDASVLTRAPRSNNTLNPAKLNARAIALGFGPLLTAAEAVRAFRKLSLGPACLVTGGAGFIGSHYVRFTLKRQRVVVLDSEEPSADAEAVRDLDIAYVKGSILNSKLLNSVLTYHDVTRVVHFAAQTHVDASFTNSIQFTDTNVLGTHTLLEAVRLTRPSARFVHISTDEVYGDTSTNTDSARESTSILLPTNPYAASKVAAEALVRAYVVSYGLDAVIVRMNNVYGPCMYIEKVIPRFCMQAIRGLPICIQGSGLQTRHFLFVEDAVRAIELVADKAVSGAVVNVASADEISIVDLAARIWSCAHNQKPLDVVHIPDRNFNDKRYWINSDVLTELGWRQTVSLDEGLERTLWWYFDFKERVRFAI